MRNQSKVAEGWWDYTTLDQEILDDAAGLQAQDLLALSRAGRRELKCERVSLSECVKRAMAALASFLFAQFGLITAIYANGNQMIVQDGPDNGIWFEGPQGRIFVNRRRIAGKPVEVTIRCTDACGLWCEKTITIDFEQDLPHRIVFRLAWKPGASSR